MEYPVIGFKFIFHSYIIENKLLCVFNLKNSLVNTVGWDFLITKISAVDFRVIFESIHKYFNYIFLYEIIMKYIWYFNRYQVYLMDFILEYPLLRFKHLFLSYIKENELWCVFYLNNSLSNVDDWDFLISEWIWIIYCIH